MLIRCFADRSNLGKAPLSEREPLELFYEDVTPDRLSALEAVFGKDEESDSDSDAKAQSPHTPPPSYSDRSNNETPGKRKRGPSEDRLIPDFLPAFPVKTEVLDVNVAPTVVQDAEFARETTSRLQQGEERSKAGADAADQAALEAKTCTVIDDMTGMPKRSVEDSWQSAVPFSSSMLASGQTADDIPGITEEPSVYPSSEEGATSSMRAFANDYPVLVREARASTPAYLTPSGGAYARVFHQRRAVAAFLTDSSKYVPCDTIFGSISARPSALPFQPTSSMLITPPTSHNSAPTFTPLRPNGRDLPSTTVQSNALYPACRHRNPSNVLNAARLVSGGVGTETYRRMTRIHDPDPILDEQHAERVFHGQPAPKELLVEGNSFLKGALDMLKVKRAEDKAGTRGGMGNGAQVHEVEMNGTDEKQTSQLSMSATRDRIKVKSGTIVSTWDWMSRDHTDAVLPGKKFRTGTAGVMLGGGASGDANADEGRMRHPSESVAGTPGPA